VRKEEVLHRGKEARNILHSVNRSKANWIGHILRRKDKRGRGLEVTTRRTRRRKQLLRNFKENRGYWKLKEKALDHTL
jgi:hypothetical protein